MDTHATFQRIKGHRILQVIRCKMCICHCLLNGCVAKNLLKRNNVSSVHHKMAGERMPQHMCSLAFWQIGLNSFQRQAEFPVLHLKQAACFSGFDRLTNCLRNWHCSLSAIFGFKKRYTVMNYLFTTKLTGFTPARPVLKHKSATRQ